MQSNTASFAPSISASQAAFRTTMAAGPIWAVLAIAAASRQIDNAAGAAVYLAVLIVLLIPYALAVGYVIAPALSWPFPRTSGPLEPIAAATALLALAGGVEYWTWLRLLRGEGPPWLMIPFYLALLLVLPGYTGCIAYALKLDQNERGRQAG